MQVAEHPIANVIWSKDASHSDKKSGGTDNPRVHAATDTVTGGRQGLHAGGSGQKYSYNLALIRPHFGPFSCC